MYKHPTRLGRTIIVAGTESKEEGNDQESIQSSTTPDPGHHMGK